jgi:uncharacterized protein (TIGR03437 family)
MTSTYIKAISATFLLVAAAAGQNPDHSGNASLKGDYFVREVLMTGNAGGSITAAASVIGVATFDGNGNYTFKGQGTSLAAGANPNVSLSGTYNVASNSLLEITSLAETFLLGPTAPVDVDFGGLSAIGPSAFVASATEQTNVTMLVGIPAGSNVSNTAFKGAYTAGTIDYPGASITDVREATFTLNSDGAGNIGNVPISGAGALLGSPMGTALNQTAILVTYALSGEGSGTINFGAPANSQLVSGTKVFYISADGNLVLGGSATGYDMLVGMKALPPGTGTNATASGDYFIAALEDEVDPTGATTNLLDAYYGSTNALGNGTALFHNRFQSLQFTVYDYTLDSTQFDLSSSGTVPAGGDTPYSYTFGVNGQAYIATGDTANASYYSLTLGLAMQKFSGSGVYLSQNGIVNSGNFAPITNPIAPNELITLFGNFGAGLSSSITATTLPLPTTLGPISVTINGTKAPLDYVSATQIIAQVPSTISPSNNVYYATIVVTNNNVASNPVTVYTSNTAPGVFANPVAVGAAAAEHADGSLISSGSAPKAGDTIVVFMGGLGAVNPPIVPDGGPAIGFPPGNIVTDLNVSVDFSYVFSNSLPFIGATPTTAGLYQIDVVVPTGTPASNFLDVGTTDGYTSMTTIAVGGTTGAARAPLAEQRLKARNKTRTKADLKPRVRQR